LDEGEPVCECRHSADVRREVAIRTIGRSIHTRNRRNELVSAAAGPEFRAPEIRATVTGKDLKEIGWTKGRELAKLARAEGQSFECAPWVHKARSMPREEFAREVEKELTGRDSEPHEIMYFKIYRSQIPVIEQALETAGLMLGTDKSRGYCLEMICADFLAGANLGDQNPETLLYSMTRFFKFLPGEQQQVFLEDLREILWHDVES
jgi:hypothetical protein